jgi:pimeloyl-ACP methyl ester carboxylesterase
VIARLQQAFAGAWLLAFLGLVVHLAWRGPTVLAVALLLLLLLTHAMVLGVEFLLMLAVNRKEAIDPPTARNVVHAWLQECLHAPRVFGWLQPFRSGVWPDVAPDERVDRRGVVLVHGFFCNRGVWNDWLEPLHQRGTPTVAVNLEPPWGPIDAYVETIERAVRYVETVTGQAPLIVAHSMGGLAVRRWWIATQPQRLHHLITLGTPHRGAWLAQLGFAPNVRQMRCRSEWLDLLDVQHGPERAARMTCFFSVCDNIVFPATHATVAGASNRLLPATAHVHMVSHPAAWQEALRHLDGQTVAASGR